MPDLLSDAIAPDLRAALDLLRLGVEEGWGHGELAQAQALVGRYEGATRDGAGECPKAPHDNPAGGYLHAADDDTPFDVDGVLYCGRCHYCCNRAGQCQRVTASAVSLNDQDGRE